MHLIVKSKKRHAYYHMKQQIVLTLLHVPQFIFVFTHSQEVLHFYAASTFLHLGSCKLIRCPLKKAGRIRGQSSNWFKFVWSASTVRLSGARHKGQHFSSRSVFCSPYEKIKAEPALTDFTAWCVCRNTTVGAIRLLKYKYIYRHNGHWKRAFSLYTICVRQVRRPFYL